MYYTQAFSPKINVFLINPAVMYISVLNTIIFLKNIYRYKTYFI